MMQSPHEKAKWSHRMIEKKERKSGRELIRCFSTGSYSNLYSRSLRQAHTCTNSVGFYRFFVTRRKRKCSFCRDYVFIKYYAIPYHLNWIIFTLHPANLFSINVEVRNSAFFMPNMGRLNVEVYAIEYYVNAGPRVFVNTEHSISIKYWNCQMIIPEIVNPCLKQT